MNAVVKSAAIIGEETAFAFGSGMRKEYNITVKDAEYSQTDIFTYPVKNFGRFPAYVKAACSACALALKTAGIEYGKEKDQQSALLGAGYEPTLMLNQAFFRDYVDSGRTMGRGNLFIYSLPTSAMAEISIHFGLTGPTLFLESERAPLEGLLEYAAQIMNNGRTSDAVLLWQNISCVVCVLTGDESPGKSYLTGLADLKSRSADWQEPEEALRYFESETANS